MVLRCVIRKNTEEAWLKLFIYPKYVLLSTKRGGGGGGGGGMKCLSQ